MEPVHRFFVSNAAQAACLSALFSIPRRTRGPSTFLPVSAAFRRSHRGSTAVEPASSRPAGARRHELRRGRQNTRGLQHAFFVPRPAPLFPRLFPFPFSIVPEPS